MAKIHNQKYLLPYRKQLRNEMTIAECILWRELKNGKLEGKKFRRQHGVGDYIVDFYCVSARLVIELDGGVHHEPGIQEYDEERTAFLNCLGIRIVRFDNEDVVSNIESVLEEIKRMLKR